MASISGLYNFRDLSGIDIDGGTVQPNTFFRSDAFYLIDEAGVKTMQDLNITRVVDLRATFETTERINKVSPIEEIHHPIFEREFIPDWSKQVPKLLYPQIITERAHRIASAIELIADADGAAVVHCTAGKDRTGLVVGVALSAVGAKDDDVADNYALSQENLSGEWLEKSLKVFERLGISISDHNKKVMVETPKWLMMDAMSFIRDKWGSSRNYLVDAGLSESKLDRLSEKLLTN